MSGRGRTLALLCAAQFVLVLDVTIVGVALPSIRRELGFGEAGLQWVVSAYVLAFGGLLLVAGRLADVLGRRRLFVAGIAVFTLGSLACGLAGSSAALIAARALQGTGAALATPAALALVTTTFPAGPERTRALGVWTAAAPVGGAAGLLLGGALTQAFGWPAVFLVNVPIGAAAIALAPLALPRDGPPLVRVARLDVAGAALGTAAVVAIAYALTRAGRAGLGDAVALVTLAAAVVAAVGFLRWERRAADPLLPPGTLGRRPLAVGVVVSLVLTAATTPTLFFLTLHLQSVLGWSPTATGLGYLPVVLAVVVGATAAGTAALPGERQGLASGLLNTAAQIGTVLGLAVLVAIAAVPDAPVDGFRAAFAADALLTATAALIVASRPPGARAPSMPASRRRVACTEWRPPSARS
jgi:uncharacterized membrane protein